MGIRFYFNLIVNYLSLVFKTLQYIALLLNFTCGLGNEALLHCSSLYLDTEVCRKWVSASKSDERLKKIFLSIPSWLWGLFTQIYCHTSLSDYSSKYFWWGWNGHWFSSDYVTTLLFSKTLLLPWKCGNIRKIRTKADLEQTADIKIY